MQIRAIRERQLRSNQSKKGTTESFYRKVKVHLKSLPFTLGNSLGSEGLRFGGKAHVAVEDFFIFEDLLLLNLDLLPPLDDLDFYLLVPYLLVLLRILQGKHTYNYTYLHILQAVVDMVELWR